MKRYFLLLAATALFFIGASAQEYVPSESNIRARQEFASRRLGIFLHWGIYSTYGQGEWYLQTGKLKDAEYAKAAHAFYPAYFDAGQWASAFKESGAGYVTFTSRHHDGFSMFRTATSDYNIVDGTPYGKDVTAMLAQACAEQGLRFHLYYSILDWHRCDYPLGSTGQYAGRRTDCQDYDSYFRFMKTQVREILTQYPEVGGLWLDGYWDHKEKGFDWRLPELYDYIHSVRSDCLIGNNHHTDVIEGEDFQMFERDLPGQDSHGWNSYNSISETLPLEMCTTLTNGSWGYEVNSKGYKSADEVIVLLLRAAAKNANLLINIGPQPDGRLPDEALVRLKEIGKWMSIYAPTVNGTGSTAIPEQAWGVSTRTSDRIFLHILAPKEIPSNGIKGQLVIPLGEKVSAVKEFASGVALPFCQGKDGFLTVTTPAAPVAAPDYVIEILLKR